MAPLDCQLVANRNQRKRRSEPKEITFRAKPSKTTLKEGPKIAVQLDLYGEIDLNELATIHGKVCNVTVSIEIRGPAGHP